MASENENLTQSIRPKSEILSTGLSDPDRSEATSVSEQHRESGVLQEAGLLSPGCRKPGPGNGPIIV